MIRAAGNEYAGASEFFEAARAAAVDIKRTREAVERMRSREGLHAVHFDVTPKAPGVHEPMERTDQRLDFETAVEPRLLQDQALVDAAALAIYGADGGGGVCSLLGSLTADAMELRFVEAMKWDAVAAALGYSRRRCQEKCAQAFELIDSIGYDAVVAGEGIAED